MFKPRWKKEAELLLKGSQKFIHYKRDLLEPEKIDEIQARREELKAAIKGNDEAAAKLAQKNVRNTCEKSLARHTSPGWLAENLEVFWVALVVALGVRAYFIQPFRIPTGSMQPSLNGIILSQTEDPENWKKPWFGKRAFDFIWSGKRYLDERAEKDLTVVDIKDASFPLLSRSKIMFDDGSSLTVSAPPGEVARAIQHKLYRLNANGEPDPRFRKRGPHFRRGEPIFVGERVTGDLVFVNKLAYHFFRPKRGESFVFTTIGIDTRQTGSLKDQAGGTHFIKRLAGLPGDTLMIKEPHLIVNGQKAEEKTIQRVASMQDDYPGYRNMFLFRNPDIAVSLREMEDPNYNEYFALGDNSPNSSDSRFWGPVHQYNLVGPGFFSLWPFGSGHWGFIE